jgi:hypothetical protein
MQVFAKTSPTHRLRPKRNTNQIQFCPTNVVDAVYKKLFT